MGLWIEIPQQTARTPAVQRQPLRWGCGLKSDGTTMTPIGWLSASAMGLWIEIEEALSYLEDMTVSLCDGAVD